MGGLFGFTEVRTTAGITAGVIEVAAFAALAALAIRPRPSGRRPATGAARPGGRVAERGRAGAAAAIGGVSAVALALLGVRWSRAARRGPGRPRARRRAAVLKTATINGATVLTNGKGLTLYWFAPIPRPGRLAPAPARSTGRRVTGPASTSQGVTGTLGTITRPDGSKQATYDGHPLYTYIADTAPGQAHGNNLNLNGGVWHEITVPG